MELPTLKRPPTITLTLPCLTPTPRASTCPLASPIKIASFNASILTENDTQSRGKHCTHSDTCLQLTYRDEQDSDIWFPITPWINHTHRNTCFQVPSQDKGDNNIWFPKSTRGVSGSSNSISRDPSIFWSHDSPYEANCLLSSSNPIGQFKLIASFSSILSRSSWELLLPSNNPIELSKLIDKYFWSVQELLSHLSNLIGWFELIL